MDIDEVEEYRKMFIVEFQRVAKRLNNKYFTSDQYRNEFSSGLSPSMIREKAKWNFNDAKIAAGLPVNKKGERNNKTVMKPKNDIGPYKIVPACLKCDKSFKIKPDEDFRLCYSCRKVNFEISEDRLAVAYRNVI